MPRKIAATDYAAFAGVRLGLDDESAADERRLARLDEFLDRANGRIRLAIELKYYGVGSASSRRRCSPRFAPRGVEQQIMIISLSLQAIEQVRSLAPDIPTGYLSSVSVGSLSGLPVTALALSRQRSTAQTISDAHARGLQVYVWTVNDAAGMVEMVGGAARWHHHRRADGRRPGSRRTAIAHLDRAAAPAVQRRAHRRGSPGRGADGSIASARGTRS